VGGGLDVGGWLWLLSGRPVNRPLDPKPEVSAMTWEAPDFIEVKMDAEINSYQDDFERESDDRF
jgi:hypothetical protein